ncbi:DoxX family protein [Nocardia sp. CNY236]|uniref:DoxX family protein n=1 Tax=Nocardia sp. CNY236 TaxID=1169152 RepID=UPI000427818E|nr:DoxX family protein [Nocardia sp. CNY236]
MTIVEGSLLAATMVCIVANTFEVGAKSVKAEFMMKNSAEVGLAPKWIPYLAVLEGAGVVGLVLGLFGMRSLGLAAAVGLVGFFVVAVGVHIRTRVVHNVAFPVTFLVLAGAAVGYFASVG